MGCGCSNCSGDGSQSTCGGACGYPRPAAATVQAAKTAWFERYPGPFAPRNAQGMYEWNPTGRLARRGKPTGDADGDWFVQEPSDSYPPTGVLPGGLSAAEWSAMSEAERHAYVQRLSDSERSTLISTGIREGLTGIAAIVTHVYDAEIARMRSEADRAAATQRAREAIELATVQAQRDIEIARINAGRPLTTTLATTTPMSPTTKTALIATGIGVPVLGLLGWGIFKLVTR